jgi:hypothetical protein
MRRTRRLRRLIAGMLVGLGVMTATVALTTTPAQADVLWDELRPNLPGNDMSSYCIDVKLEDPSRVQLWRCSGHPAQHWTTNVSVLDNLYVGNFRNRHFNTCLGVTETFEGQGATAVRQVPCTDINNLQLPHDKWLVQYAFNDGNWYTVYYTFVDGRKCLARLGGGTANGTVIGLKPCNRNDLAQQWNHRDASPR